MCPSIELMLRYLAISSLLNGKKMLPLRLTSVLIFIIDEMHPRLGFALRYK